MPTKGSKKKEPVKDKGGASESKKEEKEIKEKEKGKEKVKVKPKGKEKAKKGKKGKKEKAKKGYFKNLKKIEICPSYREVTPSIKNSLREDIPLLPQSKIFKIWALLFLSLFLLFTFLIRITCESAWLFPKERERESKMRPYPNYLATKNASIT